MRHKVFYIKLFHTVVFFFQSGCMVYVLYAGITRTYHWLLLVAIGAILLNGLALVLNHGRCPLTTFAERHGALKGSVTDLFLPPVIAENVFRVSIVLFPAELVLLVARYFLA